MKSHFVIGASLTASLLSVGTSPIQARSIQPVNTPTERASLVKSSDDSFVSGDVTINYKKKTITLTTTSRGDDSSESNRSQDIVVKISKVEDTGCGRFISGFIDRRPVDGNLQTIEVVDYSHMFCEMHVEHLTRVTYSRTTAGFGAPIESSEVEYFGNLLTPLKDEFIGLGDEGTHMFNNVLTVYRNVADGQPRCPNCFALRVIEDSRTTIVGTPFVSEITIDISGACNDTEVSSTGESGLYGLYRFPQTPVEGKILIKGNLSCDRDGDVTIARLAKRCMNPTEPSCSEKVVIESYTIPFGKLADLVNYEGSRPHPNMATAN